METDALRLSHGIARFNKELRLPLAQIRAVFAEVYPSITAGQPIEGDFAADAAREAGRT